MLAVSWSRLKTFNECPRKFHLQFITKSFKEEEKSIHLVKGEQLHKQLEDYVNAKNGATAMPLGFSPEVRQTLPYVDRLFDLFEGGVYAEAQIACTKEWEKCEWFAKETAFRSIWDVTALSKASMFIGDYKSGKVYPYGEGFGQLHLSAAMGLKRFPEVPAINTAYIYIEHKVIEKTKVTREPTDEVDAKGRRIPHLAEVVAHFDREFEKVNAEVKWEPTPNENCKWCPATKGQCKFSRKL